MSNTEIQIGNTLKTQDDFWDEIFNSKHACIEEIKSFGYHDIRQYPDLLWAIEDANHDWFVIIPDAVLEKATGPFSEYNDLNKDSWEHDQRVTLLTALRYYCAYLLEEIELEERQAVHNWYIETITPEQKEHH